MKTTTLIEKINNREYDQKITSLYLDASLTDYHRARYVKLLEEFQRRFGQDDVSLLSVAGRSEVGGNHTDHQHGKVIACSINLDMIAVCRKNETVTLWSDGHKVEVDPSHIVALEREKGTTISLVKGVLSRMKELGYQIGGFDCVMTSDVLVGSGMSSSAAFEDMIGYIISCLYNDSEIPYVEIAKIGQYSENVFFGKPSGLMDQVACGVGGLVNIDFFDVENPVVKKVDVDFSKYNYSLCLVDTKGSHANLTDEYAAIPYEIKEIANYFGKNYLSEVEYQQVVDNIVELRNKFSDRAVLRALHVLKENERVDKEVYCLENDDFAGFLKYVQASGNSSYKYLQNVYANSDYNNQSISIGLNMSEDILGDNGVCRVHGGGFAGTIQAFVKNGFVDEYKERIEKVFGKGSCHVLKIREHGCYRFEK